MQLDEFSQSIYTTEQHPDQETAFSATRRVTTFLTSIALGYFCQFSNFI